MSVVIIVASRCTSCRPLGVVSYDVDDKQALVLAGHVAGLPCIYTCMCKVLGCKS